MIRFGAAALVLVHNHPSGDPTPSTEDVQLTNTVQRLGASLGVELLDHVVVSERGLVSFFTAGLMLSATELRRGVSLDS
jgi:DNA repair protein RadC